MHTTWVCVCIPLGSARSKSIPRGSAFCIPLRSATSKKHTTWVCILHTITVCNFKKAYHLGLHFAYHYGLQLQKSIPLGSAFSKKHTTWVC
uniref:Secreted protein n=1 Tax=Caenorhabditis tropicalis TaxID=1561998 RepID=A0A1I7UF71_9PELO